MRMYGLSPRETATAPLAQSAPRAAVILPDGQITFVCCLSFVQPSCEEFFAFPVGQITFTNLPVPPWQKGRFAIVTNARRDAVDVDGSLDEWRYRGRRSRVVLTPRRWRQAGADALASRR